LPRLNIFAILPIMAHAEVLERYWVPDELRDYEAIFHPFYRTPDAYNDLNEPLVIACIDEGMPLGKNVAFIAGSGILEDQEELDHILQKLKLYGITSHAGCGAAAKAAEGTEFQSTPDAFGDIFSGNKAHELGIKYVDPKNDGRLTAKDMTRPEEGHIADTFYLDGTKQGFNPNLVKGAPKGFVHSRGIFGSPEIGKRQIELGVGIAMGAHGFGNRFTQEHPFNVVVITDNRPGSVPLDTLLAEANEVIGGNSRIKLHGVTLKERPQAAIR
jgi:hypothetical protein